MTTVKDAKEAAALEREARRLGVEPWALEMSKAVPTEVVADIVDDAFRSNPSRPSSLSGAKPSPTEPWRRVGAEAPIRSPAGVDYVDQIADHFAAIDKAELAKRLKP